MYKITTGRVHDMIEVREGLERLRLRVDADPLELVRMINSLEKKLKTVRVGSAPEDIAKVGREFCTAIFGKDQTDKVFDFYNGDGAAVMGLCSKYFAERLGKKITRAQKKARL